MHHAANLMRVQAANEMTETRRESLMLARIGLRSIYVSLFILVCLEVIHKQMICVSGLTVARPLRGLPPDAVPSCGGGKDFSYSAIRQLKSCATSAPQSG